MTRPVLNSCKATTLTLAAPTRTSCIRSFALAELRLIARRKASIVEAAVPAVAALLLGAFGVVSTEVAVWMALTLGLLVLAAQRIMFARLEQLGWVGTLMVVAANVGLGGLLIAMKLLSTH
jgi:hypothetical protein